MHLPEAELALDIVLPAQLSDWPFGGARVQPEKRLQVAVLADAILTFRRWADVDHTRALRLFAEVSAWFASEDTDGPFTFATICDSLGLDPAYIRRGLGRWSAVEATWRVRRDANGTRHQVVLPRLRRVA